MNLDNCAECLIRFPTAEVCFHIDDGLYCEKCGMNLIETKPRSFKWKALTVYVSNDIKLDEKVRYRIDKAAERVQRYMKRFGVKSVPPKKGRN